MSQPKFVAVLRIPIYADTEAEAVERIMPYVRDMRVQVEPVVIEAADLREFDRDEC